MAKKPIKITEVVLRDAHQSLLATRMTMDEMRPILPEMDKIPYFSVECWGGATFDSCIRFLDEDPWERLPCGARTVLSCRSSVLLPHPEGPQSTRNSPGWTDSVRSESACFSCSGYAKVRFRIVKTSTACPPFGRESRG